jgi:hypothetical protein
MKYSRQLPVCLLDLALGCRSGNLKDLKRHEALQWLKVFDDNERSQVDEPEQATDNDLDQHPLVEETILVQCLPLLESLGADGAIAALDLLVCSNHHFTVQ